MLPGDFKLHRNQTMAMQSILLSMGRGYTWHTSGLISVDKAEGLIAKFDERYGVGKAKLSLKRRATRQSRTARESGVTTARQSATLVIHPTTTETHFRWVLLATGPLEGESMQNGLLPSTRLVWHHYQLTQVPKPEGVTWTWRLTRQHKTEFEGWFIKAGRSGRKGEFEGLLRIARNYPMFSGVRNQVAHAIKRGVYVWNRQHPDDPISEQPKLPVMTRMAAYASPPLTVAGYLLVSKERLLARVEAMMDAPAYDD